MKEYPISTFLLWNPPTANKGNWHTYKFAQHFKYGEVHNEEANLTELRDVNLVLDGQQRLTSLFIALMGSYRVRPKYKRKRIESSYLRQELFLNLLKNPDQASEEDEVEGVTYGFQFMESARAKNSTTEYWFQVCDILNIKSLDMMDDYVDSLDSKLSALDVSPEAIRIARRNLKRLHSVIWDHRNISVCIVQQTSYDKVLDIFVRANDGGTKLSKSDLLMSLVTLNWRNFDAREELVTFLNELNEGLGTPNNFDRDFLLRSALLFCGQKYVFKIDSFTKENLLQIEDNWPLVKQAVRRAVQLVNSFGISNYKGNLSSDNSVMPIAYYVYQLLRTHLSEQIVDTIVEQNKAVIRAWLVSALFSGVFSGAADSTVVKATRIIREHLANDVVFPVRAIAESLSHRRKNALFDAERIEEFLALSPVDRVLPICLQLLYRQDDWERDAKHRSFIFLPNELPIGTLSADQLDDLREDASRIGNMVLLDKDEHDELRLMGPEEWLATRSEVSRAQHLLPSCEECDFALFQSVFQARRKLIAQRLMNLFPDREEMSRAGAIGAL
jgi:hypothetical protein